MCSKYFQRRFHLENFFYVWKIFYLLQIELPKYKLILSFLLPNGESYKIRFTFWVRHKIILYKILLSKGSVLFFTPDMQINFSSQNNFSVECNFLNWCIRIKKALKTRDLAIMVFLPFRKKHLIEKKQIFV